MSYRIGQYEIDDHKYKLFEVGGTKYVVPKDKADDIEERARKQRPVGKYKPQTWPKVGRSKELHNRTTAELIEACESLGAEFWAHGPSPKSAWAVKDRQYWRVEVGISQLYGPCNAMGGRQG